MNAFGDPSFL